MKLPPHVKIVLWDVSVDQLDTKKHRSFFIARLAEKGGWKDIAWLKKIYSVRDIKKAVAESRNISEKTKNFWHTI